MVVRAMLRMYVHRCIDLLPTGENMCHNCAHSCTNRTPAQAKDVDCGPSVQYTTTWLFVIVILEVCCIMDSELVEPHCRGVRRRHDSYPTYAYPELGL